MLSAGELGAAGGHTAAASAERSPTAPSPRSADREQGVPVPHPAGSCGRPEGPELGAMGLCWPGTRAGHRVSFLPRGEFAQGWGNPAWPRPGRSDRPRPTRALGTRVQLRCALGEVGAEGPRGAPGDLTEVRAPHAGTERQPGPPPPTDTSGGRRAGHRG